MSNKRKSSNITPIMLELYDIAYPLINIILQQGLKVQYKFKVYSLSDFDKLPPHQRHFKVYDESDLLDLPDEQEYYKIPNIPEGYIISSNTKFRYLIPEYEEYYHRIKDETIKGPIQSQVGAWYDMTGVLSYYEEHGESFITQFWEENFDSSNGDWVTIFAHFVAAAPILMQSAVDYYAIMKVRELSD